MKINEKYQGECVDLNHQGVGVVKIEGFPVFVESMLVGETAQIKIQKVEKSYAYGVVTKFLQLSENRVAPICPTYSECGGCNLMHLDYPKQLDFKVKMAYETFKRIGHLSDVKINRIIGMEEPYYYRNKVQIPFGVENEEIICGFYKKKSHKIISLNKCFIQPIEATEITKSIRAMAKELGISGYNEKDNKGILRHVLIRKTYDNNYMVVIITNGKNVEQNYEMEKIFVEKNPFVKSKIQKINKEPFNIILGKKSIILYGKDYLTDVICGLKFNLSYNAFFQTNHIQTEKLYQQVMDYAKIDDKDVVVDAYCGVGTIGIILAKKAYKVYGIEIVEEAVNNAIENAKLNNIKNIDFILGKAEEEIFKLENVNVDVMVMDPPRKGCELSLLNAIKNKKVPRVVYVSCNVATLARDLEVLSSDYNIKDVTLIDMFPHTSEVETVVLLERIIEK